MSDVHVDGLLTNVSTAYNQDPGKFVADRVFPILPVSFKSDKIAKFDKQPWMRSQARPRALSTESAGSGYTLSTQDYACMVYALHHDIDDQLRANAQTPFAPDRNGTAFVTNQLRLQREIQFMTKYFGTGLWDNEWAGVTGTPSTDEFKQWDQSSGSTPVKDVIAACTVVEKKTGVRPNVGLFSREVFDILKTHADLRDYFKYTTSDSIDRAMMARLFELDEVVVASAVYDSAAEGAAESMGFIAGKHVLLAYRTPNPALEVITAGYIPVWTGYLGAGAFGNRIKKFRMEHLNSDRIEGELAYDMVKVCSDAAIFLYGAIA